MPIPLSTTSGTLPFEEVLSTLMQGFPEAEVPFRVWFQPI